MSIDTPVRRTIALNEKGDSEFSWDPDNADDVAVARTHFATLKGRGMLLYRLDNNGERTALTEFDPHAERVIAVPALQGG